MSHLMLTCTVGSASEKSRMRGTSQKVPSPSVIPSFTVDRNPGFALCETWLSSRACCNMASPAVRTFSPSSVSTIPCLVRRKRTQLVRCSR